MTSSALNAFTPREQRAVFAHICKIQNRHQAHPWSRHQLSRLKGSAILASGNCVDRKAVSEVVVHKVQFLVFAIMIKRAQLIVNFLCVKLSESESGSPVELPDEPLRVCKNQVSLLDYIGERNR